MNDPTFQTRQCELRFDPLHDRGPALVFPCDSAGRVAMDALSERARSNYLFARAVVGRDYRYPVLRPCARGEA